MKHKKEAIAISKFLIMVVILTTIWLVIYMLLITKFPETKSILRILGFIIGFVIGWFGTDKYLKDIL